MGALVFLLFPLFCLLLPCSSSPAGSPLLYRRTLHRPFSPSISQPPASPPSPPPVPKYPFSTSPLPFFPVFASPPPPPSTATASSLRDLPANISSLIFPASNPPSPRPRPRKLVPAIALPILCVALLLLSVSLLLLRRRRHPCPRFEAQGLFPSTSDAAPKPPGSSSTAGSEFLYLGTLVSSRGGGGEVPPAPHCAGDPSYRRLDSPELHPLPPLSRELRQGTRVEPCCSSEEEFYSPGRFSSSGKEHLGGAPAMAGSASRGAFPPAPVLQKSKSGSSSSLSAPSYQSSGAASSPTPSRSFPSSASSPQVPADGGDMAGAASGPPFPPPRPMTPSPPRRRLPSASPPSSPVQKDADFAIRRPPHPSELPPKVPPFDTAAPLPSPRAVGLRPKASAVHPDEPPKDCSPGFMDHLPKIISPPPELRPPHRHKARPSSDPEAWDRRKWSSLESKEQVIEASFFAGSRPNAKSKDMALRGQENRVLDPNNSQKIAILLRALNLSKEEVFEALLEGNTDCLGSELLETLLRMVPSKDEELKLTECMDDVDGLLKLGPTDKFLKALLDVPFAFERIDAMLYIANFESEINFLNMSFDTLEAACQELRSSRLFMELIPAVLKTGDRTLDIGSGCRDDQAFELDTLPKLVDVKGADGKTTLLHLVVREMIRSDGTRLAAAAAAKPTTPSSIGAQTICPLAAELERNRLGLQAVAGLSGELHSVRKAAAVDPELLSRRASNLVGGVKKVEEVLIRLNAPLLAAEEAEEEGAGRRYFHEAMLGFLREARDEIPRIPARRQVVLSAVEEITERFRGNAGAQPFRIFAVVRDFLSSFDQVCREAAMVHQRTMVGASPRSATSALLQAAASVVPGGGGF